MIQAGSFGLIEQTLSSTSLDVWPNGANEPDGCERGASRQHFGDHVCLMHHRNDQWDVTFCLRCSLTDTFPVPSGSHLVHSSNSVVVSC